MSFAIVMPRLSETCSPPTWPRACQRCGAPGLGGSAELSVWQEHDDGDRREPIFVVLCKPCVDRVIEPHPRLYRELGRNEPAPGVMSICGDCRHADRGRCRSPRAAVNGGPGLRFPAADSTVHIQYLDKRGRRCGKWLREWNQEAAECEGHEPR